MPKPINRTFGWRRREWLGQTPFDNEIHDGGELPGDVSLKVSQNASEIFEKGCGQLDLSFGRRKSLQNFADQVQSSITASGRVQSFLPANHLAEILFGSPRQLLAVRATC